MIKLGIYYKNQETISLDALMISLTEVLNNISETDKNTISHETKLEKRYLKTYLKSTPNIFYEEITIFHNTDEVTDNLIIYIKNAYANLEAENIHIIRFYDTSKVRNNHDYYHQLFVLEMKLRLYCTRILNDTYSTLLQTPYHKLHLLPFEEKNRPTTPLKNDLAQQYENDLFYLGFKEYSQLNTGYKKDIQSPPESDKYFQEYHGNFETSQDMLDHLNSLKSTKLDKKYSKFLTDLKNLLSNVEPMRNCIAHHRFPSEDIIKTFNYSVDEIKKIFKTFEQQEELEENSKTFGKDTQPPKEEESVKNTTSTNTGGTSGVGKTLGVALLTIAGGIILHKILNDDDNDKSNTDA